MFMDWIGLGRKFLTTIYNIILQVYAAPDATKTAQCSFWPNDILYI